MFMTKNEKRNPPRLVHADDVGLMSVSKNQWVNCPHCNNGFVIEWVDPRNPGWFTEDKLICRKCKKSIVDI